MTVYIGFDWSQAKPDLRLLEEAGAPIAPLIVLYGPEGFARFEADRQRLAGIETAHNLVIDYLWGHSYNQALSPEIPRR